MNQKVLNKIITEINTVPEDKLKNLVEYIHFLKWVNTEEDDYFSPEEINQIKASEQEEGIDWREVRSDV